MSETLQAIIAGLKPKPFGPELETFAALIRDKITTGEFEEAGRLLIQAKKLVRHGRWMEWVQQYIGVRRDQAVNYMSMAKRARARA
jgi:hypothetical protein